MERLESKFYEKYTALKKRKLLDEEGLERKREEKLKELYDAFKDWVSDLQKDNAELNEKLVEKEDELEKARLEFLEDIRTRDSEILRLKKLLDEKARKNSTLVSPKRRTPVSHGKVKRIQLSENAPHSSPAQESQELECNLVSENAPHSSPAQESQELECNLASVYVDSGNGTNEVPSAHMLCLLLQSLVRMKISVTDESEIFSISASHEATGYSFTLTWLENSDEWSYKLTSLGALERIAAEWMRQDIRFGMTMCRMFFERIASIITKG